MFFKKIKRILSHLCFLCFENVVCSLVNIFCMEYCNEIKQLNTGCNKIELNIAVKLQNVSRGEQIKKKKVINKTKKEKIVETYIEI